MRICGPLLVSSALVSTALILICAAEVRAADEPAPAEATGYFVDCNNGDDAFAGTSAGTAWRTLSRVNDVVETVGADVWLKAGSTCNNQTLTVDWGGTSSDRVVVGSYYVSGGAAYQNTPTNPLANPQDGLVYSHGARAIVSGSYVASCRVWPSRCDWNTASNGADKTSTNATPSSQYGALITIAGAPYVTVQDLIVRDSAGIGIQVDGNSTSNNCRGIEPACEDYSILQRNKVSHTSSTGILFLESRYGVIRENEQEYDNLAWKDSQPDRWWGAGISAGRCDPCNLLIENNYTHDGYGEAIGPYGVSYVLVRGNRVANNRRVSIYFDGDADVVAEQNIIAGGAVTAESGLGDPDRVNIGPAFYAMSFIKEPASTSAGSSTNAARRNVFRNNLVANFSTCFETGIDANQTTNLASGYAVGNTCVGASGTTGFEWGGVIAKVDPAGVHVRNNIFAVTAGTTNCNAGTSVGSSVTTMHNYWTGTPANANCRSPGTGDVYSTYAALGLGAHNFATSTKLDFPTYDWFLIPPSSDAAAGGVAMENTYLSASNWSWVLAQRAWRAPCQTSQISVAEFAKVLTTDYCGQTRLVNSPNMGALEDASNGSIGYTLSVD